MIRWIKSRLTMYRMGYLFMDTVVCEPVYEFEDCYGDRWMASSVWSMRVKLEERQ